MKYKMQFMDDEHAERAYDELTCTKVLMGSAIAVDFPYSYGNTVSEIISRHRGYTDQLTEHDLSALSSAG